MLRDSCELPEVKEYLSIANRVLGYDLLDICLNGTYTHIHMHRRSKLLAEYMGYDLLDIRLNGTYVRAVQVHVKRACRISIRTHTCTFATSCMQ